MRKIIILMFVICLEVVYLQAGEWKLVWCDEFDYQGLPDSTKWTYEQGFVRNMELQYYTHERKENARVQNGMLVLETRKESYLNAAYNVQAGETDWRRKNQYAEYTSASVTTQGKAGWRYGKIEVRAKLPTGKGMWPAIWMLGTNITDVGWPACGEIDIMENVGFNPDLIHANVHTEKYNHVKGNNKGSAIKVPQPHESLHIYAIEWDAKKIDFFIDDQKYFTYVNEGSGVEVWPFDQAFYLILNIAFGGSWGSQEGIDEQILPQRMYVDYVRVYQREKN